MRPRGGKPEFFMCSFGFPSARARLLDRSAFHDHFSFLNSGSLVVNLFWIHFRPVLNPNPDSASKTASIHRFKSIFRHFRLLGPWGPGTLGTMGPGAQGPWGTGTLGHRDPGAQGPWGPGTLGPRDPGAQGPWGPGTLGHRDPGAQGPWGPGAQGPWGPGTLRAQG